METFTGLRTDRFARLVNAVRERGGNGPGGGLPPLVGTSPATVCRVVQRLCPRMGNCKILRDCRQRGDGLHHAVAAMRDLDRVRVSRQVEHPVLTERDLLQHPLGVPKARTGRAG